MMGEEQQVAVVRAPATSANMGPGYDCLGLAVDLWNTLKVSRSDKFEVIIEGEGADNLSRDESNLVVVTCKKAFEVAGKPFPTLKFECTNRIPMAAGLGSSSAAVVSGLMAGLVLSGKQLNFWKSEELMNLACVFEGHPDNVTPCIYGGVQLGYFSDADKIWRSSRINYPHHLQLIIFVPDRPMLTAESRGVLDKEVSRDDAVYNIRRAALLVNALNNNELELLDEATGDKLHQPGRSSVYPELYPIMKSAKEAGASASYLSGAGSSIMALSKGLFGDIEVQNKRERCDNKIGKAMMEKAKSLGLEGRVFITRVSFIGAKLEHATDDGRYVLYHK